MQQTVVQNFCFVEEPWQSVYMHLMLPGLIIWIVGAVWCFRKNNIRGSVILQVLGAIEIVIGGIFALIFPMNSILSHGAYDPAAMASDFVFFSKIPIIGLILHFILLAFTLIIAIRAKQNLSKLQALP